jgi:hypothetical protein
MMKEEAKYRKRVEREKRKRRNIRDGGDGRCI